MTPTESEKNRHAAPAAASTNASKTGDVSQRLYIGGLHPDLTDSDIKQVFEPFGSIDFVTVKKAKEGYTGNYAFIQYVVMKISQ